MDRYYDSKNPAPGVRVAPMVKGGYEKITGLTPGQSPRKNYSYMPEHLRRGPQGLGMVSASRCSASESATKPTRPVFQHRPSGKRGYSGTCCKPKQNRICREPLPTKQSHVRGNLGREIAKVKEALKLNPWKFLRLIESLKDRYPHNVDRINAAFLIHNSRWMD